MSHILLTTFPLSAERTEHHHTSKMEHYPPSLSSFPLAEPQRRRIIAELQKGHRAAHQLHKLLINELTTAEDLHEDSSTAAVDLAVKIINSFSNCLSIVDGTETHQFSEGERRDYGEGSPSGPAKNQRGCYKRRKTGQTRTVETLSFPEDSYGWRKYGNKTIMNSVYPRQYFKCTHKADQSCQATKTVQQVSNNPCIFRTVYNGEHTCQTPLKASQILSGSSLGNESESSMYLSFGGSNNSSTSAIKVNNNPEVNNSQYHHSPSHQQGPIKPNSFFSSPSSSSSSILLQNKGGVMMMSQPESELGLISLVRHNQDERYQSGSTENITTPAIAIATAPATTAYEDDHNLMTMNRLSLMNPSISSSSSNYNNFLDSTVTLISKWMTSMGDDVVSTEGDYSCSTTSISSQSLEMNNFIMSSRNHTDDPFNGIFDVDFD